MSTAPDRPASADWVRDELILALDVYFRLNGAVPGPRRSEILELSALLRVAGFHGDAAGRANFRSPASVVMKLMNFRSVDPDYGGKGLTAGGRLDREVWQEMAADRPRLVKTAATIRRALGSAEYAQPQLPLIEGLSIEAEEGALLTRIHLVRERDRRIVQSKKDQALKATGHLSCEVCDFSFSSAYGAIGEGFAECHHRKPLSELVSGSKTTLDDLALVCANCHRMIHGRRPWLSIEQLRAVVTERRKTGTTNE